MSFWQSLIAYNVKELCVGWGLTGPVCELPNTQHLHDVGNGDFFKIPLTYYDIVK